LAVASLDSVVRVRKGKQINLHDGQITHPRHAQVARRASLSQDFISEFRKLA
jgi:hypothetical protein